MIFRILANIFYNSAKGAILDFWGTSMVWFRRPHRAKKCVSGPPFGQGPPYSISEIYHKLILLQQVFPVEFMSIAKDWSDKKTEMST